MTDKNGIEIKTGDVVEVTGAYFKNDNGLYFVQHSPGDPNWCGKDHCLCRIKRTGELSTAKNNLCFWPVAVFVSSRAKAAEANAWNREHAEIEVKHIPNRAPIAAYFAAEADSLNATIQRYTWDFGEDCQTVKDSITYQNFLRSVAARIRAEDAQPEQQPEALPAVTEAPAPAEQPEPAEQAAQPAAAEQHTAGTRQPEEPAQVLQNSAPKSPEQKPVFAPAPEQAAPVAREPAEQSPAENRPQLSAPYYEINEETARTAHYMVHMSDYRPGSATAEYRRAVDKAAALAEQRKSEISPYYHGKLDSLLNSYARKLAAWTNDYNRNQASYPSQFISGAGGFNMRKHNRQMTREDSLWEEYREIQAILGKIEAVGTGPVDLSDPHAREMLADRLNSQRQLLEDAKAANAYYRKHKTLDGCPGISEKNRAWLTRPGVFAKGDGSPIALYGSPFPAYELQSLRGKIQRTEQRLAELDKLEAQVAQPRNSMKFPGGEIVRNAEQNRLQILFDAIPGAETRAALKSNGFRWSPKNQAWQRQLTANAETAARAVLGIA